MFEIYLDESGHTDPSICVVAGYAASSEVWDGFNLQWQELLGKYQINEFHAQPFFSRDPQGRMVREYKGWSEAKMCSFLSELINAINSAQPVLIGTALVVADFFALSPEKRLYLTGGQYSVRTGKVRGGAVQTPFHVAMQNTTIQAAKFTPVGESAHFVCDEQKQYCPYVIQRFKVVKERHPELALHGIVHASSKKMMPLQAADLAAYLGFQFAKERLKTDSLEPSSPFVELLGGQNRFDYLDIRILEAWTRDIPNRNS